MRVVRSKRGATVLLLLLLLLFLFRPGIHQLRNRIAGSIGSALGRRVELQDVRLRFLPRPGFELDGLAIYDDPSFSAEPMVRADEVSAPIRFSSLLRGRLEIATLSANEPSINLVRDSQGHWNLSTLLQRSAQIPAAPTGKRPTEARPAFPYLEATHARINFKVGQEKTFFALDDADVALWQESENSWGARLAAAPVRTDFHLTDTGLLRVNATWQRSATLSETPLIANVSWQKGQLGQITKLVSGHDRGWRGAITLNINLSGTPETLLMRSQMVIDDFRRYDISSGNLRLATQCSARYNATDRDLNDIFCESPVADGFARLRGRAGPLASGFGYEMTLSAEKLPLSRVMALVREAKKGLPADLAAGGSLDGEFHAHRDHGEPPQLGGSGSLSNARLITGTDRNEIILGDVPLTLLGANNQAGNKNNRQEAQRPGTFLHVGPFPLAIGGAAPAVVTGAMSRSGYEFSVRGDTSLKSAFRLATTLGIPNYRPAVQGAARIDLAIAGNWHGFVSPEVTGSAEVKNARAEMRGFNQPIEISSMLVALTPDSMSLQRILARTGNTRWAGSATVPRHCAPACPFQFNLAADQLSSADLVQWFTSHPAKRAWYQLLSSGGTDSGPSPFTTMKARGNLRVNRFDLQRIAATQLSAQVDLDNGSLVLSGMRAQLLQGAYQGSWKVDFSHAAPRYDASGLLQNISLAQLSGIMNDSWATGTADVQFQLSTSGLQGNDLLNRSDALLRFTMRNGSLPHLDLPGSPKPFPVHKLSAELHLKEGQWALRAGKLESRDGIYQLSGTASADTGLEFVLTRSDDLSWNIRGTLANTTVSAAVRTEAKTALKP